MNVLNWNEGSALTQKPNKKSDKTSTPSKSTSRPVKPTVRGSHADRSAAMRKKLMDAGIDCLNEFGYGAVTMQRVTDKAGVSRGAFLHHFPTRIDLILAVAEDAAKQQNAFVADSLRGIKDRVALYEAITMTTWSAMLQPPAIALLEIMMGARSDPELLETLPTLVDAFQSQQMESVWKIAQEVGIKDRDTVVTMVRLHVAAMRGLVLERMYSKDTESIEEAMKLLVRYKDQLSKDLLA